MKKWLKVAGIFSKLSLLFFHWQQNSIYLFKRKQLTRSKDSLIRFSRTSIVNVDKRIMKQLYAGISAQGHLPQFLLYYDQTLK